MQAPGLGKPSPTGGEGRPGPPDIRLVTPFGTVIRLGVAVGRLGDRNAFFAVLVAP